MITSAGMLLRARGQSPSYPIEDAVAARAYYDLRRRLSNHSSTTTGCHSIRGKQRSWHRYVLLLTVLPEGDEGGKVTGTW